MPTFTIDEINDGGDPECDIDTIIARCVHDGVETELTRTEYSRNGIVRYSLSQSEASGVLHGKPCTVWEWSKILVEFKKIVADLPA